MPERSHALRKDLLEQGERNEGLIHHKVSKQIEEKLPDARHQLIQKMRRARIDWENLIGKDGAYEYDYRRMSAHAKHHTLTPPQFFALIAEEQHKDTVNIEIPPRLHIDQRIPFYHEKVIDRTEDPEMVRMRKALHKFGFTKLADVPLNLFMYDPKTRQYTRDTSGRPPDKEKARLQHMVVDMMHFFDTHDPASLCKADEFMVEDAKDFIKKYGGMKVMQVEMRNLSGLNNINYELGNAALRETGNQIQRALRGSPGPGGMGVNIADHVYHKGGGNFMILLPPQYRDEDVKATVASLKKWMDGPAGLANRPVVKFAFETFANPNPAYFEKTESFEGMGKRKQRTDGQPQDEKTIRAGMSTAKLEKLHKRLSAKQIGKHVEGIKMADIPSPKEHPKPLGIDYYYNEKDVIRPGENVEHELDKIAEAAKAHFDNGNGKAAGVIVRR
jgi:hypothetical protein